nr:MAG TPA: hypothetical protein [Caudoviricetes sp.]
MLNSLILKGIPPTGLLLSPVGVFLCVGNVEKNNCKIVVDNPQHTAYISYQQRGRHKVKPRHERKQYDRRRKVHRDY